MKLESNDFEHEGNVPTKFTCDGTDVSPHLAWSDVPEGTKSFALIVDDPDAPMGIWVHWLVCDISPDTRDISEDSIPLGAKQVTNDFGNEDYGGPCPPSGVHRYFFKLFALDVEKHKIAEAILMGRYGR